MSPRHSDTPADTENTSPVRLAKQAAGQWRLVAAILVGLASLVGGAVTVRAQLADLREDVVEVKADRKADAEKVETVRTNEAALTSAVTTLAQQVGGLNNRLDTLFDRLAALPPEPYADRSPPRR